jgi:hypothetical protein
MIIPKKKEIWRTGYEIVNFKIRKFASIVSKSNMIHTHCFANQFYKSTYFLYMISRSCIRKWSLWTKITSSQTLSANFLVLQNVDFGSQYIFFPFSYSYFSKEVL